MPHWVPLTSLTATPRIPGKNHDTGHITKACSWGQCLWNHSHQAACVGILRQTPCALTLPAQVGTRTCAHLSRGAGETPLAPEASMSPEKKEGA